MPSNFFPGQGIGATAKQSTGANAVSEADERERIAESPVFCEAKNGPRYNT